MVRAKNCKCFALLDVWEVTRSEGTREDYYSNSSSSTWSNYTVKIKRSKPTKAISCASPGYSSSHWCSKSPCFSSRRFPGYNNSRWLYCSSQRTSGNTVIKSRSIWLCYSSQRSPGNSK